MPERRNKWEVGEVIDGKRLAAPVWTEVVCVAYQTAKQTALNYGRGLLSNQDNYWQCYVAVKINDKQWAVYEVSRMREWVYKVTHTVGKGISE